MKLTDIRLSDFLGNHDILFNDKIRNHSLTELLGDGLKAWIANILKNHEVSNTPVIHGSVEDGAIISGSVFIDEGAAIEATALIKGPCYIAKGATIRHGAYIRGNVYVGANAVVGHATEVKGAMFLDEAKAGHFAYVGDAILGPNCNLGAGTKIANLKLNQSQVRLKLPDGSIVDSGMRKFGAIIGADVSTGCNSVLSPGSLLYPNTFVMPCTHFHGTLLKGLAR